jgi:hypothetical protein
MVWPHEVIQHEVPQSVPALSSAEDPSEIVFLVEADVLS